MSGSSKRDISKGIIRVSRTESLDYFATAMSIYIPNNLEALYLQPRIEE